MKLPGFDEAAFREWLLTRPQMIQDLAARLPAWNLYRMKVSGCRCTIHGYSENGTLIVNVTGQFNRVLFSRQVFGVSPDDLEECDLPAPGEDLGDTAKEAGYTEDDIRNILIPRLRAEREAHEQAKAPEPPN